jgi:hypothetical protein
MAVQGTGEHLAAAKELLAALEPETSRRGSDVQVRATAALAHAVLAVAEQVAMLRHSSSGG